MKTYGKLPCLLLVVLLLPAIAWSAPPSEQLAGAAHAASLGCRWRRCVTVVPVMPRADESVRLLLNLDQGPPYFVEMVTETKQVMKVMGQEVSQTQTQKYYLQWTPAGKNQQGQGLARMQFIGIKMKIDIGGVQIAFDSTERTQPNNPMTEFFKSLLDAELTFVIDAKELKITNIGGHDVLIKKLGVTNPQMEPLLNSIINRDALAQMVAPLFNFLPQNAVRRSDTWERSHVLDLGPIGSYRTTNQYTYDGKAELYDKILIRSSLRYEAPKDRAGLPYTIKSAALKSTAGTGEILFDAAKGRLVESTLRQTLAGSMTIEVGGMESRVELEQTQTARMRVTDVNPLAGR